MSGSLLALVMPDCSTVTSAAGSQQPTNRNFHPSVSIAINRASHHLKDPAGLQRQNIDTVKSFGYYKGTLSTTKDLTADLLAENIYCGKADTWDLAQH